MGKHSKIALVCLKLDCGLFFYLKKCKSKPLLFVIPSEGLTNTAG